VQAAVAGGAGVGAAALLCCHQPLAERLGRSRFDARGTGDPAGNCGNGWESGSPAGQCLQIACSLGERSVQVAPGSGRQAGAGGVAHGIQKLLVQQDAVRIKPEQGARRRVQVGRGGRQVPLDARKGEQALRERRRAREDAGIRGWEGGVVHDAAAGPCSLGASARRSAASRRLRHTRPGCPALPGRFAARINMVHGVAGAEKLGQVGKRLLS